MPFLFTTLVFKFFIMAGTLNKVMLIGHTGDEVKMTYFEGGGYSDIYLCVH